MRRLSLPVDSVARVRAVDALLAAGFVVLWSSGFVGAELSSRVGAVTTILTWRFVASVVVLAAFRAARPGRRLRAREVAVQALVGLLAQAGYLSGVVYGVQLGVPTGTAALIAALQPLAAGVLAGPLLGERVRPRQWAGLVVGLGGVAMVVANDLALPGDTPPWAYALPFAAMVSLVSATMVERRAGAATGVVDGLAVQTGASAAVFVAVAAGTGTLVPPAEPVLWLAVAWTVVLSGFGGYGFYWLNARRAGVTRLNVLLYLTPPTTALWALAMFGEPFGPLTAAGMLVCGAAVPLVYWHSRRRAHQDVQDTLLPS